MFYCRIGGRDNFIHCDICGLCLLLSLKETHKCVQEASRSNCPVCMDVSILLYSLHMYMYIGVVLVQDLILVSTLNVSCSSSGTNVHVHVRVYTTHFICVHKIQCNSHLIMPYIFNIQLCWTIVKKIEKNNTWKFRFNG